MIRWFFDGLRRQCNNDFSDIQIVVVDYFHDDPERRELFKSMAPCPITHVPPKPTVWQGPWKLTKNEYFAAANARNTAICHAAGDHIAFIDDLSVMGPLWLCAARDSIAGKYVAMGMYRKVKNPVVEDGIMISHDDWMGGMDTRYGCGNPDRAVKMSGNVLYGCSAAGPTEAWLSINGFDEACDSTGLGSEDYIAGIMLNANGWETMLDQRMWTYEWWEGHVQDKEFLRKDKGVSPNDKSHAILNMVTQYGRKVAPNYFPEGGIRAMRQHILAGGEFPTSQIPDRDWYDGQPLSEL